METMGVKYIGSKAALIEPILAAIDGHMNSPRELRVIDVFTGTTRVAQAFRTRGWSVQSSDLAWASEAYAHAFLKRTPASGVRIPALLRDLNSLADTATEADWITRNYCDVSGATGGTVRMWKRTNGLRADAIRNQIAAWEAAGEITTHEAMILVACLLFALDRVDNSVGIQQAYLKDWAKRTSLELRLVDLPYPSSGGPPGIHTVADCLQHSYEPADVAYIDPPYSSHSYATYYHIWDSITRWDKPAVGLTTNRRIDRVAGGTYDASMSSPWNSKKGALKAFMDLAERLPVRALLISYNDESIVPLDTLIKAFKDRYGAAAVSVQRIPYKRNIMATIGNAAAAEEHKTENTEALLWVWKN